MRAPTPMDWEWMNMVKRSLSWLVVLASASMFLALLAVIIFVPRVLYPSPTADLRGVNNAESRIRLVQA